MRRTPGGGREGVEDGVGAWFCVCILDSEPLNGLSFSEGKIITNLKEVREIDVFACLSDDRCQYAKVD